MPSCCMWWLLGLMRMSCFKNIAKDRVTEKLWVVLFTAM